jgi:hypothetical protein
MHRLRLCLQQTSKINHQYFKQQAADVEISVPWSELRSAAERSELDLRRILAGARLEYSTAPRSIKRHSWSITREAEEMIYQRMLPVKCRNFQSDCNNYDVKFVRANLTLIANVLFSTIAIFYVTWYALERSIEQNEFVRYTIINSNLYVNIVILLRGFYWRCFLHC